MVSEPHLTWGVEVLLMWGEDFNQSMEKQGIDDSSERGELTSCYAYAIHMGLAFARLYPELAADLDKDAAEGFIEAYTADVDQDLAVWATIAQHHREHRDDRE